MSYVESRPLTALGTGLAASPAQTDWFLGSSMGREMRLIAFTINSTLADLNLDWRLIHPAVNGSGDSILLTGRLEDMVAGVPVRQVTTTGTLGYHAPMTLRFTKQSDDTFSTNAKAIAEMMVTIEYEDPSDG